ncbi:hypothetical protein [Erysipelothrix sp. strain 2 (EsS2-6-Brazil)]|uniref:hypothetical protein n=1 Tax=Erysipelothrix sp. strain 2 (EsS2-6-Brazil) TaxID=2500549 RepID=UPI00190DDD31|nr:hypothetical protein [Erysipelothrix sp. strain 2 (EsS2-6-Brazil)]MBK2403227.1 hypothetical protein [Erysipelothrix sp. strain 2 (EsS2-6-Brazil)]
MKKIFKKKYTKLCTALFILVFSVYFLGKERTFVEEFEEIQTLDATYELKEDPEIFVGDTKIESKKVDGEQKVLVKRIYSSKDGYARTPHRIKKGYYLKKEVIDKKEITKEPKDGVRLIGTKVKTEKEIHDEKLREGKQLSVGFVEGIYHFRMKAASEYNKMEITIKDAYNNKYVSPKNVMIYRGSRHIALTTENEINKATRENTIEYLGNLYDRNGKNLSKVLDFEEDYTYYLVCIDSDKNTGVVGVKVYKD